MIRKINAPELLSESEIQLISESIEKYINKEISILHLLKLLEIKRFMNFYYIFGTNKFKELITEEQCVLAILFSNYLGSLLLYNEFKKFRGLSDYVRTIFRNNKESWTPNSPIDPPLVDFSNIS